MTGLPLLKKESQKPNMGPEDVVVQEVVSYFSTPRFKRFSKAEEYSIQMGSDSRRADVVLIDKDGTLAAIIECKRSGYEGSGPDQLKSYLSATDTPLGVFANETDPAAWKFYENRGQNQFNEIDRFRFEARILKRDIIKTVSNFVRSLFQRPPDESPSLTPPPPEPFDPPIVPPDSPSTIHIEGGKPLQNANNIDVHSSLNGQPYYSEASGFYWAANHQGMAECVPQHVKRIISDEELQVQSNREQFQAEISELAGEKNRLEEQKREYEQEIRQRSQELARKREELVGLEVQLQAPTETELNPPSVKELDQDDVKQQLNEEISQLREEKDKLEQTIEGKSQELARKREELAGLEVQLQAPTETELTPGSESVSQVPEKKWYSRVPAGLVASVATIAFICVAIYLYVFYASAVDKAFFLHEDKIREQVQGRTYVGVQDIVNPWALRIAWEDSDKRRNYFILFFPWLFLGFALVIDHWWESDKDKRWYKGKRRDALLLGFFTLVFDFVIAYHISQKIYLAKKFIWDLTADPTVNPPPPPWSWDNAKWDILTVILCGFFASLLVSFLYNVTRARWAHVKQLQPRSKEQEMREVQIADEKTQRDAQIAVLNVEMETLQNEINPLQSEIGRLNEKVRSTQQRIDEWSRQQLEVRIRAERSPIEAQIAILKIQMETLQGEIDQFNDKVKTAQQRIDQCQAKIEELSDRQNQQSSNGVASQPILKRMVPVCCEQRRQRNRCIRPNQHN